MDFLKHLNPLIYFTHEEYISFWNTLFMTVLTGFFAKTGSIIFFLLGFWYMVRKQNIPLFVIFFFLAVTFAYSGGIIKLFKG